MVQQPKVTSRPLPAFIIAGAPRSGTTYLYNLLDHHPEIYLAKPRAPEPKFFLVDEEYAKGLDYYSERFFSASSADAIRGEKSANYLESTVVPERIFQHLPNSKLIFVLRDPVERAFSNFLWSTRNGHETLSFAEAIKQEAVRESCYAPAVRFARPFSHISRGMYAKLLQPYLRLFPSEQVKIVLHDDIVADPARVAADLMAFVGATVILPPIDLNESVNTSRDRDETRDQVLPQDLREQLCQLYAGPNQELQELIGRDLSHWSHP
ncbi:MAG: sulfotransferase [Schlesneria sp.]|nr:sulfotransferase [Schlesneria sp.]